MVYDEVCLEVVSPSSITSFNKGLPSLVNDTPGGGVRMTIGFF